jgi:hypothetical protein
MFIEYLIPEISSSLGLIGRHPLICLSQVQYELSYVGTSSHHVEALVPGRAMLKRDRILNFYTGITLQNDQGKTFMEGRIKGGRLVSGHANVRHSRPLLVFPTRITICRAPTLSLLKYCMSHT